MFGAGGGCGVYGAVYCVLRFMFGENGSEVTVCVCNHGSC